MIFSQEDSSFLLANGFLTDAHVLSYIILEENGFVSGDIVRICKTTVASKKLAALRALFTPMIDAYGQYILDANQRPITQLTVLRQAGFPSDKLAGFVVHNGGANNLEALQGLLTQFILDANQRPITQLVALGQAGFTSDQLARILGREGGGKSLKALQALLIPMTDAQGRFMLDQSQQPITQLTVLGQAGFSSEQLANVLANKGGSKNLEALQGLLKPLIDAQEQPMLDANQRPITQLTALAQAGFTIDKVGRILAQDGGAKSLKALQALLTPMTDSHGLSYLDDDLNLITHLTALGQAGFTSDKLANVLANKGGSKNLEALQGLLKPMIDAQGQFMLDANQRPITQLTVLAQAGFASDAVVSVVANSGGSGALAALQALLTPLIDAQGQPMLDANQRPMTQLTALAQAGFTSDKLILVAAHNGGANSLEMLQGLLKPMIDAQGQPILDANQRPMTQLTVLGQAGFTSDKVGRILAQEGGVNSLEALQALLTPLTDAEGVPCIDDDLNLMTHLTVLGQAGFTSDILTRVLANHAGSKNLETLQGLLKPMINAQGQSMLDANQRPITQLTVLAQAGFTSDQLLDVIACNGGSNNFEALQDLLTPMIDAQEQPILDANQRPMTQLTVLAQAGFTSAAVARVVANDGGSGALAALQALLTPLIDAQGQLMLDANQRPLTQQTILAQAGFLNDHIIEILRRPAGAKSMGELLKLLENRALVGLLVSNSDVFQSLYALASSKSKSQHLAFLGLILKEQPLLTHMTSHPEVLSNLCKKLAAYSATDLNKVSLPKSIPALKALMEAPKTVRRKRPAAAAAAAEDRPPAKRRRVVSDGLTHHGMFSGSTVSAVDVAPHVASHGNSGAFRAV